MKRIVALLGLATALSAGISAEGYPKTGPWDGRAWGAYSAVYPRQTIKNEKTTEESIFFGTQAECIAAMQMEILRRARVANPTAKAISLTAFVGLCWPENGTKPPPPAGWPRNVRW